MTEHPNAMQLDLHALGRLPELSTHVDTCASCAAFVAESRRPPPPRVQRVPLWIGGLVLVAGSALVFVRGDDATEKGGGIAVFVKHGDKVTLWDGQAPLAPGDAIMLELPRTRHVVVRDRGQVLFEATDPPRRLPASFRVDDRPENERLLVERDGTTYTLEFRKVTP